MRISVIIPTLGRGRILADALRSLAACDPPPDEIVVVDGDPAASARPPAEAAREELTGTDVHYVQTPPGTTRQRNEGLRLATGDVVVFFDDDAVAHPAIFALLLEAFEDPGVAGATGRVIEPPSGRAGERESPVRRWLLPGPQGRFTRSGFPRYLRDVSHPRDVEFMPGCFMAARSDLARRVEFDETMAGYALAEDEDFSYRLSRLGRLRYLPDAVVHHRKLGFRSSDPRAHGRRVVLNRAYLYRKNFRRTPLASAQFGFIVMLQVAHRLVNRDVAGARGLVDGAIEVWRQR